MSRFCEGYPFSGRSAKERTFESNGRQVTLTPRELELIHLLCQGITSSRALSKALYEGPSARTVILHLNAIYYKFGIPENQALSVRKELLVRAALKAQVVQPAVLGKAIPLLNVLLEDEVLMMVGKKISTL